MDHCAKPGLLPLADALTRIHDAITPIDDQEKISLLESLDRVIANSIYSSIAVPGHDNSAMDGYAFRFADIALNKPLRIVGESFAGHAFKSRINEGECVRIMTGAVIPENADTVVMQENVLHNNDAITFTTPPNAFENIRRAGEDIAQGALVFSKGHRITPVDIGLLASLGITELHVFRKLRVAIFSTGDELTPPNQPLAQGQIYDSNRYALIALLQRLNVECIDVGLIPDDRDAITEAFTKGISQADVIISSGGVSVGDADYTKDVLEKIGQISFWKIAMKPGKPFAFGSLNKNGFYKQEQEQEHKNEREIEKSHGWFFGLPGNPVSAVVTFHQLVLPALRYLAGEIFLPSPSITAIAHHPIKKQPGRTDFQRGILHNENGINYVSTTGNQSSGVLTSIAQANCYIVLAQESSAIAKGDAVQVLMFDKFLR